MNIIGKIIEFIGSLKTRTVNNPNTTAGGIGIGVVLAALVGQLETSTGCHFQEAFAGIDWMQVIIGTASVVFGASVTDAKKTV